MNTHETYVSLETAKLLKQAGFDWKCDTVYQALPDEPIAFKESEGIARVSYLFSNVWKAPTLEVAQRWLRQIKNYHICVQPVNTEVDKETHKCDIAYVVLIYVNNAIGSVDFVEMLENFETYEKAEEAGIKRCLEEDSINDKCSEE